MDIRLLTTDTATYISLVGSDMSDFQVIVSEAQRNGKFRTCVFLQ